MNRFTRKTSLGYEVDPYTNVFAIYNELGQYEDAEEAGALLRLPLALEAECYYVNLALHEVCPAEIVGFEINKYTKPYLWITFKYVSKRVGRHICIEREDLIWGKLLFNTEEEAEQALKDREAEK